MTNPPLTHPNHIQLWLRKLLNVEHKEIPVVIGSILMFFLLFTSYAVLRPVRETMGIAGGVRNLQWLFTATFVISFIVQIGFGWLASKVSRQLILPYVYGFFITNLLLFILALFITPNNVWIARSFYVWLSIFNLLAVSLAWSLLTDIMNPDQSKRLFAIVASGASFGSILGPIITVSLVNIVGIVGLMLISVFMLIISSVIAMCLYQYRNNNPLSGQEPNKDSLKKPLGGNPFSGMAITFKSSYLIAIALFVVFASASSTFIYFELMKLISIDYPIQAQQTQIFSIIDLFVNISTVLLQIAVVGRIAKYLGLGILLVTVPIIITLGFISLAFMPIFGVAAAVMIIRRIGQYAMIRPSREMLYTILTPEEKYKAKNFIDTVLYRGGDVTSAWLTRGLDLLGGGHSVLAMIGGAVIAACWAVTGVFLTKHYNRANNN